MANPRKVFPRSDRLFVFEGNSLVSANVGASYGVLTSWRGRSRGRRQHSFPEHSGSWPA